MQRDGAPSWTCDLCHHDTLQSLSVMLTSLLLALVSISARVSALGRSPCCQHVQLNVQDSQSEFHIMQGARLGFYSQIGFYGARPQYKYNTSD